MQPSPAAISICRRISWADTDASGYYHNTAALLLAEEAEICLLEALGLLSELYGHLPRVRISIEYMSPLRFHDAVEIRLSVMRLSDTSVFYSFTLDKDDGSTAAGGDIVAVRTDEVGRPAFWSELQRRLLTTAGDLTGAIQCTRPAY